MASIGQSERRVLSGQSGRLSVRHASHTSFYLNQVTSNLQPAKSNEATAVIVLSGACGSSCGAGVGSGCGSGSTCYKNESYKQ